MDLSLVSLALFNLELKFNNPLLEIHWQSRGRADFFCRFGLNRILAGSFKEFMRELGETLGKAACPEHVPGLRVWFRLTHVFFAQGLLSWDAHEGIAPLVFQVFFLVYLVDNGRSFVLLRGLLLSALKAELLIVTPKRIVHTLYDLRLLY